MPAATAAPRPRTARERAARSRPTARRGPIRWQRVGRLALLGTLAVILLLYIPPLTHWLEQRSTQSHGEAQLKQLQAEHNRLKAQLDSLSSTAGVERAATGLGMVRQDQRAFVIEQPPAR